MRKNNQKSGTAKEGRKGFNVFLPVALIKAMKQRARDEHVLLYGFIERALKRELKRRLATKNL